MKREISIKLGSTQYSILSKDCNEERLEKAVQRLINEQQKERSFGKYDDFRSTVMIAISSFYEYDELKEKYDNLLAKDLELEKLTQKYEELLNKEVELDELNLKYEELLKKHNDFESQINLAAKEAARLSRDIAIRIA